MHYNKSKAVSYARQWAGNGPKHEKHNPDYKFFEKSDCTNFVSQCLHAGGIPYTADWYFTNILGFKKDSKVWGDVVSNFKYFRNPMYFSNGVIVVKKLSQIKTIISRVQPGDLLYWDYKAEPPIVDHATIISSTTNGKLKFCGHSSFRTDAVVDKTFFTSAVKCLRIVRMKTDMSLPASLVYGM